jgi:hypothetical protein
MKATELIGRNAIRTAPTKAIGDRSYTNTPILILNATDSHIVYKHAAPFEKKIFGDEASVLGCDFADDNWTDYDELMHGCIKVQNDEIAVGEVE